MRAFPFAPDFGFYRVFSPNGGQLEPGPLLFTMSVRVLVEQKCDFIFTSLCKTMHCEDQTASGLTVPKRLISSKPVINAVNPILLVARSMAIIVQVILPNQ
jgi:hypothetical protein